MNDRTTHKDPNTSVFRNLGGKEYDAVACDDDEWFTDAVADLDSDPPDLGDEDLPF